MTDWILEGELGTCAYGEETPEGATIIDVRDLTDGECEPLLIRKKIEIALKSLNIGTPVIVRCRCGISRSNGVAVAILCKLNGRTWEENENLVKRKVGRTQILLTFKESCLKALEEY